MNGIARYTEQTWDREQRNRYLTELDRAFDQLADNSELGQSCNHFRSGYRVFPVSSPLIFHQLASGQTPEIIRVLHERMNVSSFEGTGQDLSVEADRDEGVLLQIDRLATRAYHSVQLVVHISEAALMDAITYTKARATLAQTIDSVCENHEPVIITKKNDRSVVMLSLEDFQALEETSYLLRNPKNARRLLDSVNELDAGGGSERALTE